jgi:excisionase family DNA binding protein
MQIKIQKPVLSPEHLPVNYQNLAQAFEQIIFKSVNAALALHALTVSSPVTEKEPEDEVRFSIPGLADYLRCTKATIHAYKKRGVFPYYQTGRTVYFKKCEVDAALSANKKRLRK